MKNKDLQDFLNLLEKMKETDKLLKELKDTMGKAIDEPCEIKIIKGKDGNATIETKGTRGAIVLTLAGAKKDILKRVGFSDDEFEFVSKMIGTRDRRHYDK